MASRSGTAALQSQPASILKPSRGQTQQSRGSRQQTRQQTRQTSQRGDTRGDTAATGETEVTERTGASRQTLQTGDSQRTGGRTSQRSRLRTARSGAKDDGDGDNVKTDDIWNKFVADDGDVIKPPTAESVKSRHTGSQRSRISGSLRGSQINEEDEEKDPDEEEEFEESDDDRTVYSDYYLPPEYERYTGTPEIRAEIVDAHEACSCFPDRSSKHLGSMLYDKIVCKHTGIAGETQSGVFKFNPYWNENMEIPRKLRKRDMRIAKTKFIMGYPRPKFELVSESEEDEEEEDSEEDEESDSKEEEKEAETRRTATGGKSRKSGDAGDSDNDDDDDESDDDDDEDDEDDDEDEDYLPFELPQIGYPHTPSLPPSSQSGRSRRSMRDFDDDDDDDDDSYDRLPSLPASRQLTAQTAHSKRTGVVTQRTQRTQFTLPSQKPETKRSTRTAKTSKSKAKLQKDDEQSLDSGYDERSSRRSTASRQSLPQGPVISTTRTFQGKFYDPVTKQMMLYDIGTRPGDRLPVGILEPLFKPPTVQSEKPISKPTEAPGSKAGSRGSKRSQKSHQSDVAPKAALVGAVFISNLLSKNKRNKEALEAGYSDEEDGN